MNPNLSNAAGLQDYVRDYTLRTAPAEVRARVAELLQNQFGVKLDWNGGVWTLTHAESAAWLQKPHTLTLFGAIRVAAHMQQCMAEGTLGQSETAEQPRFGNRQNHSRRRR
jgi:hypothetical protein